MSSSTLKNIYTKGDIKESHTSARSHTNQELNSSIKKENSQFLNARLAPSPKCPNTLELPPLQHQAKDFQGKKKKKKKKSLLVSAEAKAESNERLSFQEANPNILQTSVHIFK